MLIKHNPFFFHYPEMVDMKQENKSLYKKIDGLRQGQRSLEEQVEKLTEELAAEYLKYRDECDARKLLISDINDLRYQQEDNMMSKQNMQDMEEEKDDPVMLKIALKLVLFGLKLLKYRKWYWLFNDLIQ